MSRKQDFIDPDLKTPAHDAIMIWLHENAAMVADQVFGISAMVESAKAKVREAMVAEEMQPLMRYLPDLMGAGKVDIYCVWECPCGDRYRTGYVDLKITAIFSLPVAGITDKQCKVRSFDGEWDYQPAGTAFAYLDGCSKVLACEVKPVIRSIGELVRQLRQYEEYNRPRDGSRVAVVSPDDRFRSIIESQGFVFVKAPTPDIGPQRSLI